MPLSRERMREYQKARRAGDPERALRDAQRAYGRLREREASEPGLRERRLATSRAWQEENRERLAEQARLRYERLRVDPVSLEELRARNRDGQLRYRGAEKNREKVRARWLVGAWLRRGKLKRGPCAVCGSPHSESHHADYGKPLEVEWLCREHHLEQHAGCAREPTGRWK